MGWPVVFSLCCREDLRKIVEYIAADDAAAAERFALALTAQAEALAHAPHIGVPMRERPGARFFPFGSYLIIYRLAPAPPTTREIQRKFGHRCFFQQ